MPRRHTARVSEDPDWAAAAAPGSYRRRRAAFFRPLPFAPLLALGDRAAVRPDHDPRGRYVRAQGCLLTPDGVPLAACEVRFAGSAAYTRRLLQPFLETTDPEILFRLFPNARTFGQRGRSDAERPT